MLSGLYENETIDKNMLADLFLVLDHNFEEPIIDRSALAIEYFIKNEVNKLTGLTLTEFFNLTEKEISIIKKCVDSYNRRRLLEHEKQEKALEKGKL